MHRESDTETAIGVRRRRIVLALEETEEPMTIDEIVDVLSDDEAVESDAPGTPNSWEELHHELYEFDLPALADVGLVQFDADRGLVGTPRGPLTGQILEGPAATTERGPNDEDTSESDQTSPQWPEYYLTLSAVTLLAGGTALVSTAIPESLLLSLLLVLFVVLSAVHFWIESDVVQSRGGDGG